eukprot:m.94675 g.94675  ORF g.94675 m.94675 type:complete len:813 (+) comp21873_c0_seq1:123-2561(+)
MGLAMLTLLVSTISATPTFFNSCTENFKGGARFDYPFCNTSLPIDQRLDDLIERMTFAEKTNALDTGNPDIPRLGVPRLPGGEGLHGVASSCAAPLSNATGCPTSYPCPTALGATLDKQLWNRVGHAIGLEARALVNQGVAGIYLFTPNINLVRDPRWGRIQEVMSEDPTINSEYAKAYISGFQYGSNSSNTSGYLLAAATAKHWLAYDLEGYIPRTDPQPRPESGTCDTGGGCQRWNFDAKPPLKDLQEFYLPPFQGAAAVNVRSMMCAYSGINGQPACSSDLNKQIAMAQWQWDGFFVSDCTALELMQDKKWDNCKPPYPPTHCVGDPFSGHNFTHTIGENAYAALVHGAVSFNCGPFYRMWLDYALQNGSVSAADVDRAVRAVYTTHFRLGLLDPADNQPYMHLAPSIVDSADHRLLALEAAHKSIVLLKNKDGILPLKRSGHVAFIGPHANSTQDFLANYHGTNTLVNSHSPLLVAQRNNISVSYARGCNICDVQPPGYPNMPCPPGKATNTSGFAQAVEVAKAADVAILFVGNDQTTEAENFDRKSLTLPGVQEELVLAVAAAQPNTIVVLVNGGPIDIGHVIPHVSAVLEAFYPGELGGDAIVDTLFGDNAPSAKLPYTVYFQNFTLRDIRTMDLRADGGVTHMWFQHPVLFPFGFGLHYTTFNYSINQIHSQVSSLALFAASHSCTTWIYDQAVDISSCRDLSLSKETVITTVQVNVCNSGARASDVILLGLVSSDAHPAFPKQRVADFARLPSIVPKECRHWSLEVKVQHLLTFLEDGRLVLFPGEYQVLVEHEAVTLTLNSKA